MAHIVTKTGKFNTWTNTPYYCTKLTSKSFKMQFRSCNGYLNTHDISRSIEIKVPAKCQISPNPLHYFKQDT